MAAGRPLRPNDPSMLSSLEAALTRTRRPGPLDFTWHWRWELGILAGLTGLSALIATSLGVTWLIVAAGAGLAALGALSLWPPARSRIAARFWCVVTPHRIRAGCANAWVQTRSGRLPVVVSCRPAYFGERARLWCLAGITATDLFAAREILAAACWAADVRVIPDVRRAHLVTIEVIRRNYPERTGPSPEATWPYLRDSETGTPPDPEDPAPPRRAVTGGALQAD